MTLDHIIECYKAGTLAKVSDVALHEAQVTVATWQEWRVHHPDHTTPAVPALDLLKKVYDYLENLVNVRYGCND